MSDVNVERVTNKDFAQDNLQFKEACAAAGVKNTPRQASKYREGRGLAAVAADRVGKRETLALVTSDKPVGNEALDMETQRTKSRGTWKGRANRKRSGFSPSNNKKERADAGE